MLLHNGGDWMRKLIRLRFRPARIRSARRRRPLRDGHGDLRMLPFERVQHAVLALSFLTLVWTGFALKYPGQLVGPAAVGDGGRALRCAA